MSCTVADAPVRVLLDQHTIQSRVAALGAEISRDYNGLNPVVVAILKGSMPFFVDLSRAIETPHTWDTLQVSSYHGGTTSSGVVKFNADLSDAIEGRHVILFHSEGNAVTVVRVLHSAMDFKRHLRER